MIFLFGEKDMFISSRSFKGTNCCSLIARVSLKTQENIGVCLRTCNALFSFTTIPTRPNLTDGAPNLTLVGFLCRSESALSLLRGPRAHSKLTPN